MTPGNQLLHDYVQASAERRPDAVALVARRQRLTYGQIDGRANALAHRLVDDGVTRGDRVVIFGNNTPDTAVAYWGALKANAVPTIVSPLTKPAKLHHYLQDSRAAALVTEHGLQSVWTAPAAASEWLKTTVVSDTGMQFSDERVVPPPRRTIDVDLASIVYTSGSTSQPKGVMLTHRNMLATSASVSSILRHVEDDVILSALPLSFDYGLYQMIMAFREGARLVLEDSFVFPAHAMELIAAESATVFPGVPTMFALLVQSRLAGVYDLSSVRAVTNTAAALPLKHIAELRALFPAAKIYSMYGLTECKRCTWLPPEDLDRKPTSVGLAIPNTELWIVDEQDQRVGPNEVGQLVIRGATVMRGYWENPAATAERLRPGPLAGEFVLYTGDYCRLDDEGYLYFVARMDDIIKSRGEKVPPKEVEAVLYNLAGLRDAAVVGIPDPVLGEAIKAFVVLEPGALLAVADIRRHCAAHLEPIMVPRDIEIVADLPRTATGKIRKSELLRDEYVSAAQPRP